ncbi:LytR/AlgR family response regulator transcription factor [Rosettibacter firmus]|uniref:LytR/AlgR family response regulator transcription factor n=1 Tax=Rosettibacter firmus TaxID=3111522 RepID=UPI00336C2365
MNQNKTLTAIIVDDELHGRENLKKIIELYCPEVEVLDCAESVPSAMKIVEECNPDVVFLDISMPVLDGFDFLNEFEERNFMVVFVTAYEEFGIKAVKANVADYLLKPINIKELKLTIKKLLHNKQKNVKVDTVHEANKLVLPASHGYDVLEIKDVIRLEAQGCYTKIFLNGGKYKTVSRTLKDFEDILPKDLFFRTHKSHIVNLKCIKGYSRFDGYYVLMMDNSKVEISRRKVSEFLLRSKELMKTV